MAAALGAAGMPPLVGASPMEQFAALNISVGRGAAGPYATIPPAIAAQMAASHQTVKSVRLWVPNAMVGAIIGSKVNTQKNTYNEKF